MSRRGIEIAGKDIVVGWDGPLQTYFADDGEFSTMLDGSRFDLTTVTSLEMAMLEMTGGEKLPEDIVAVLEADKAGADEPTELQKMFAGKLKG